ncbi:gfo/Idh/MocA family oxidoreductase, partial [Bacteroidota bacterium]
SPILLETFNKEQTFNVGFPDHVHQPLIEQVVLDLLEKGESPSTGETGLRTSRVLDWIVSSK